MTRITFPSPDDCHLFSVGDRVSGAGSEIVVAVRPERCEITTAPATWWRRAWYWSRARVRLTRWWLRSAWADSRIRFIWWLHLAAPLAFVDWHISRLDANTLHALAENDFWPHRKP